MAGHAAMRGMFGQWLPFQLFFAEEDSTVVDGEAIAHVGILEAAGGLTMPLAGKITGLIVGSEAGAGFGIIPTVNDTDAAAAYLLAIAAAEQSIFYATPLAFAAGDVLGLKYEGTVSAQRDVYCMLLGAWDLVGG